MPYLLPHSGLTGNESTTSVCVHFPDVPEFRSALLGALLYFTKWTAWERDEDHTGTVAAKLWRDAHEKTVSGWLDVCVGGCADMCSCDEIRTIIVEEMDKMAITNCVTVNCGGGGCCCGNGGKDMDKEPTDYVPPDIPPKPEPTIPPPTEEYLAFKCARSYELHYVFREASRRIGELFVVSDATYTKVNDILFTTLGIYGGALAILWDTFYLLMSWLGKALAQATMSQITSAIAVAQELFVCAAYGSSGVNDASGRWRSVIDSLSISWAARYYLKLLEQSIDYAYWLFPEDWQTIVLDITWARRSCANCQGPALGPEPTLENYRLLPVDEPQFLTPVTNNVASFAWAAKIAEITKVTAAYGWDFNADVDHQAVKDANNVPTWETVGMAWKIPYMSIDTGQIRMSLENVTGTTDIQVHPADIIGVYDDTDTQVGIDLAAMPEFTAQFTNGFSLHGASVAERLSLDGINGANAAYDQTVQVITYILVKSP